jgi:DNA replication and repair protein RecF
LYLKRLELAKFRNYQAAYVEFDRGINLLVGKNGQGKTNLVEAIRYLSVLKSHRVAGYLALINENSDSALIRAMAVVDEREALVEVELNRGSNNRARVNRSDLPKQRDILGLINSVIFAPEDLDIVKRDPSNRRDFVDELVVQVWPRFAGVFSDYERVLKQRNSLLKSARITKTTGSALATLDAWDASLAKYGSEIIEARLDLITRLTPFVEQAYKSIASSKNQPSIEVKSSILGDSLQRGFDDDSETADQLESVNGLTREELEARFHVKLATIRPKELERGLTLIGPQRDDLAFKLGTLPVKGYASHGESWSFALALRLASVDLLRAETKTGDPILILDDVFAELDAERRLKLAELVQANEQVFITAAVAEDVPQTLKTKPYFVRSGEISNKEVTGD